MINTINIIVEKNNILDAHILKSFLDFIGYNSFITLTNQESNNEDNKNLINSLRVFSDLLLKYKKNNPDKGLTDECLLKFYTESQKYSSNTSIYQYNLSDENYEHLSPQKREEQIINDFLKYYQANLNNIFNDQIEVLEYLKKLFIDYNLFKSLETACNRQYLNRNLSLEKITIVKEKIKDKINSNESAKNDLQRLTCSLLYLCSFNYLLLDEQHFFYYYKYINIGINILNIEKPNNKMTDLYEIYYNRCLLLNHYEKKSVLTNCCLLLKNNPNNNLIRAQAFTLIGLVYTNYTDCFEDANKALKLSDQMHTTISSKYLLTLTQIKYRYLSKKSINDLTVFLDCINECEKKGINQLSLVEIDIYLSIYQYLINFYFNHSINNDEENEEFYHKIIEAIKEFILSLEQLNNNIYLKYFFNAKNEKIFFENFLIKKYCQTIIASLASTYRQLNELEKSNLLWEYRDSLNKKSTSITNDDLIKKLKKVLTD